MGIKEMGSMPKLNDISRQTTDASAVNEDEYEEEQETNEDDSEHEIKVVHVPSRVSIAKNEYLDDSLVMFGDGGKLLNQKEETFISLNEQTENDEDTID